MPDTQLVDQLRVLMAVALAGLLLLLRLDAPRFSAAEYDTDQTDDSLTGIATRLAWPALAVVIVAGIAALLPAGRSAVGLGAGTIVSPATILWAILGSALGVGAVFGLARMREPIWPPRLRPRGRIPRLAVDAIGTAVVDELTFRGVVLGLLLLAGLAPAEAFLVQLLLYGLETRLGRSTKTLDLLAETLALGFVTGLLALLTGGVVAPLVAHAVTRFAALDVAAGLPPILPRRFA
jgi:hypothetical protein